MRAVHDLDLTAESGKITALIGANGAGKSSTIMCIAGHVTVQGGEILYDGTDITGYTPMQRVQSGIGIVPEGRRLFGNLTVKENLVVGSYCRDKSKTAEDIDQVLEMFPRLGERIGQRASSLSGGEQQMLAMGRALMSRPKLLLIDELSLGLMPKAIDICYNVIAELKLKEIAIILVEQSTQRVLEVADSITVLESGKTAWNGKAEDAKDNSAMIDALLGLK